MPGRSARSPSDRGAAARARRDRPVGRSGLPVLPVDDVLDAQRRSAALRRDRDRAARLLRRRCHQRADHRAPERALVRHDAGHELHPLRDRARLLQRRRGVADPAEWRDELHQPGDGGLEMGRDPLGARDHDRPQRDAQPNALRHSDHRHGRQPHRRGRGRRADPARQGVVLRALLVLSPVWSESSTRSSTGASTRATSASTTSCTPSAPA